MALFWSYATVRFLSVRQMKWNRFAAEPDVPTTSCRGRQTVDVMPLTLALSGSFSAVVPASASTPIKDALWSGVLFDNDKYMFDMSRVHRCVSNVRSKSRPTSALHHWEHTVESNNNNKNDNDSDSDSDSDNDNDKYTDNGNDHDHDHHYICIIYVLIIHFNNALIMTLLYFTFFFTTFLCHINLLITELYI